jgi:NADPH:quinone reductase-like Zn-dependent oxidoreductase
MKAIRVRQFGPPSVLLNEDLPKPKPGNGQLVVRVKASGVGPWDAWIRSGTSVVHPALPLTPGSDLAGVVEAVGAGVTGIKPGEEVYGVTNKEFIGSYAEYALADAGMMARKPSKLDFLEAASVPVVAVTAWQMLFEYAHAKAGQTVLIQGAAGNVGAYAVQMARDAGLHVTATASSRDVEYVLGLGASKVIDYQSARFEDALAPVDIVLDLVGGETRERSFLVLKPDGILVSAAGPIPEALQKLYGPRAVFFLVDVTTSRLDKITGLFDQAKLATQVGSVLPLDEARAAHEMLEGAPHKRGKIVLKVAA